MKLKWDYDPLLDCYECKSDVGRFLCVRTHSDLSKLYLDDELLRVDSGGHTSNLEYAEEILRLREE